MVVCKGELVGPVAQIRHEGSRIFLARPFTLAYQQALLVHRFGNKVEFHLCVSIYTAPPS